MNMHINHSNIDDEVARAVRARRPGYPDAVVVKSWLDETEPWLGFFFENGRNVGEVGQHKDGTNYQVIAIVG